MGISRMLTLVKRAHVALGMVAKHVRGSDIISYEIPDNDIIPARKVVFVPPIYSRILV